MEFGQIGSAKLPVTEFEAQLIRKCEQFKRVKLYLATRAARKMPMGYAGGEWKPKAK